MLIASSFREVSRTTGVFFVVLMTGGAGEAFDEGWNDVCTDEGTTESRDVEGKEGDGGGATTQGTLSTIAPICSFAFRRLFQGKLRHKCKMFIGADDGVAN